MSDRDQSRLPPTGPRLLRWWRRWRWIVLGVGGFVCLWLVVIAGNSLGRYLGWFVPAEPPEAVAAALRPYYRTMVPPGEGPFPTALLYSGCDGPHDNLDRWADMLNARGWAAIVVDSHSPRDFQEHEVWRLICAGQLLMGSERASDVLVSIHDARRMKFVDPDRLVLIGSSHGGWAIMELLAFEKEWRLPYGLSELPGGATAAPLDGVVGAILLYPYCGTANRARRVGWSLPIPVLFLLAGRDAIAPADACLEVAGELAMAGLPVETRVFDNATHGFDQKERAPFSFLQFDPEITAMAMAIAGDFLDRADGPPR
ncbi:dienelactone hydrolase family protein [Amaricoccus sp.]|uniref:dienelactone hydrolase family protein n=1 Tax=Amaricoccus sp. TaxID=1872485 RepID=UPI001B4A454A|nr:dienelactone hydrolase family protein [Amaricoccus sp.]MBP7242864.1 dienelactone hydrolase family protein [Amaricoccus sp.]